MKFGRLLASGKSLVNGDVSGRYRMEKSLRLPKFISPRNPFKQEKTVDPASPPPTAVAPAVPIATIVADVLPPAKINSLLAHVGDGLQKVIMFCLDHNPFSAIGKPKLSGIPRFGQPEQQGELSLDREKKARNDLAGARLIRAGFGQK